jgi:DMSO reductase anchor subunit
MSPQWPLMLFTFFICASSGVLFFQGMLTAQGKGKATQLSSIIASTVLLVVGGICVFFHLQHWERIFNGFGHITSGITQELIGCVVLAVVIVLYFLMARRAEDGQAPKWTGILAMIASVFMVFVLSHSYFMSSRPVWDTWLLLFYYLVNAGLLGGLCMVLLADRAKDGEAAELSMRFSFWSVVAQTVVLAVYAVYLIAIIDDFAQPGEYFDPTLPDVAMTHSADTMMSVFTGSLAVPFWVGTLLVGCLVPMWLTRMSGWRHEFKGGVLRKLFYKVPADAADGAADAAADAAAGTVDAAADGGAGAAADGGAGAAADGGAGAAADGGADAAADGGAGASTDSTGLVPRYVAITLITLACVIVGCFCWRSIIYIVGITKFAIF